MCRQLEDAADGAVPGWQDYLTAAAQDSYDARPGTFGDLLAGSAVTAIGPTIQRYLTEDLAGTPD